jgi:hypothetical protein
MLTNRLTDTTEAIGVDHDEPNQCPPEPARPPTATSVQSSRTTVRLEDGAALLTRRFVVPPAGFEPAAFCSGGSLDPVTAVRLGPVTVGCCALKPLLTCDNVAGPTRTRQSIRSGGAYTIAPHARRVQVVCPPQHVLHGWCPTSIVPGRKR